MNSTASSWFFATNQGQIVKSWANFFFQAPDQLLSCLLPCKLIHQIVQKCSSLLRSDSMASIDSMLNLLWLSLDRNQLCIRTIKENVLWFLCAFFYFFDTLRTQVTAQWLQVQTYTITALAILFKIMLRVIHLLVLYVSCCGRRCYGLISHFKLMLFKFCSLVVMALENVSSRTCATPNTYSFTQHPAFQHLISS